MKRKNYLITIVLLLFTCFLHAQNSNIVTVENMEFIKLENVKSFEASKKSIGMRQYGKDIASYLEGRTNKPLQVIVTFAKTEETELVENFSVAGYLKKCEKQLNIFMVGKISFFPENETKKTIINNVEFDQFTGIVKNSSNKKQKMYINLITTIINNERYFAYVLIYAPSKKDTWEKVKQKSLIYSTHLESFKIN